MSMSEAEVRATLSEPGPMTVPVASDAGRSKVTIARNVVLGGAALALLIGLAGGMFALNPIALGIAMALFHQVLQGKRWARIVLIGQQSIAAALELAVGIAWADAVPLVLPIGLVGATSSAIAVCLLANRSVGELVSQNQPR